MESPDNCSAFTVVMSQKRIPEIAIVPIRSLALVAFLHLSRNAFDESRGTSFYG